MDATRLEELEALVRARLESAESLTEFALLRALKAAGAPEFGAIPAGDNLALFRQHFLLFHLLYRLRDRLRQERCAELRIHALRIAREAYCAGTPGLEAEDPLRTYYLDITQLHRTTADEVEALLAGFWSRVTARDERAQALAVLGLESPIDLAAAKRRYRRLAMQHHPDRGGDPERLKTINWAMGVLVRCG